MGSVSVTFSAEQAAASLWDYGEDELVERALALTDAELREIWSIAGRYWDPGHPLPVTSQRIVLGHVSALAVITYLEGAPRPLARERRRPTRSRPERLRHPQPVPPGRAPSGRG
jgi:hypothetical protein